MLQQLRTVVGLSISRWISVPVVKSPAQLALTRPCCQPRGQGQSGAGALTGRAECRRAGAARQLGIVQPNPAPLYSRPPNYGGWRHLRTCSPESGGAGAVAGRREPPHGFSSSLEGAFWASDIPGVHGNGAEEWKESLVAKAAVARGDGKLCSFQGLSPLEKAPFTEYLIILIMR